MPGFRSRVGRVEDIGLAALVNNADRKPKRLPLRWFAEV